jgi:hypothetical protein
MTEYDNIVVAAQEHAAKHAGAFCVFSYRKKWQMLYRQSVWLYAFYKSYISPTLQV